MTWEDYDQVDGWPQEPLPVHRRPVRVDRRPLWLRALCPRPNGHVHRMVQAKKVRRQPGVLR